MERELKKLWVPILNKNASIRRAFLARALYDAKPDQHVILALCSGDGPDMSLIDALRVPYATIFHRDCPLDMVFLAPGEEAQIESVCLPFYSAV